MDIIAEDGVILLVGGVFEELKIAVTLWQIDGWGQ